MQEKIKIPENPIEQDHKMFRVTFYDHCWLKDGQSLTEIKDKSRPYIIQEFGYLLKETNKYIVLSLTHYRGETNTWELMDSTVIMKSNILELKEVKIS